MSDTQPSSPQHFANADLAGSTFEHVDLRSSRFHHVDLRAADIRNVDLTGSRLHEVDLVDVRIDGDIDGFVINGVDVGPLLEAELDRQQPDRVKMRPCLDEALALRHDRAATVRRVVDELTDEQLASDTERVDGEGWPPPKPLPVRQCLLIVLNEEWQHRLYAERDLDALLDA